MTDDHHLVIDKQNKDWPQWVGHCSCEQVLLLGKTKKELKEAHEEHKCR